VQGVIDHYTAILCHSIEMFHSAQHDSVIAWRCFYDSMFEIAGDFQQKGLDIHCKMEYYHFDVNVKVVQAL